MVEEAKARQEQAEAWVGRTLSEKWRLEGLLGIGGMATVYAARHRNGRQAALKVLHPEFSCNSVVARRFLREGHVANKIDHPGVVAVLDDGVSAEGEAYLVMELLRGETLEQRWARSDLRLPAPEVLRVVSDVLSVLERAHAQGVIHCDIKPSNIFLTDDGTTKLLDFGIASLRSAQPSDSLLTRPGTARGTPAFMAPEQARGEPDAIGPHTDLWALGAMVFVLLSGQSVHEGPTAQALVIAAATRPARSLREVLPAASTELCALVDRALAFDPAFRWSSAGAMRAAVIKTLAELRSPGLPAVDSHGPTEPDAEPSRLPPASAITALGPVSSAAQVQARAPVPWRGLLALGGLAAGLILLLTLRASTAQSTPTQATSEPSPPGPSAQTAPTLVASVVAPPSSAPITAQAPEATPPPAASASSAPGAQASSAPRAPGQPAPPDLRPSAKRPQPPPATTVSDDELLQRRH